ncbi:MAG: hypothetical protein GY845_13755 [Planctomycetes bacterium]|nr:hypothetical protein [Planctomycetota bacterium]
MNLVNLANLFYFFIPPRDSTVYLIVKKGTAIEVREVREVHELRSTSIEKAPITVHERTLNEIT